MSLSWLSCRTALSLDNNEHLSDQVLQSGEMLLHHQPLLLGVYPGVGLDEFITHPRLLSSPPGKDKAVWFPRNLASG